MPAHKEPKDGARHILAKIAGLCEELEDLVKSSQDNSDDLTGAYVRIIGGPHHLRVGTVTRRRGTQYWYIELVGRGGVKQTYKQPQHLRLLTRPLYVALARHYLTSHPYQPTGSKFATFVAVPHSLQGKLVYLTVSASSSSFR